MDFTVYGSLAQMITSLLEIISEPIFPVIIIWATAVTELKYFGGSKNNQIGGTDPTERNIISGNNITGIAIFDEGTDNNEIFGNYIGLGASGTNNVGQSGTGVYIGSGAKNNIVGGSIADGYSNYITGSGFAGIFLNGLGTENNIIAGNFIGTNETGTEHFGNKVGIRLSNGINR